MKKLLYKSRSFRSD